jgi:hypothetical protein
MSEMPWEKKRAFFYILGLALKKVEEDSYKKNKKKKKYKTKTDSSKK